MEKLNKMSIENLAKVIGPNIMPLKETTMAAMQTRLNAHLLIVKVNMDLFIGIVKLKNALNEVVSFCRF